MREESHFTPSRQIAACNGDAGEDVRWEPARGRLRRQWQLGRLRVALQLSRWRRRPFTVQVPLLAEPIRLCVSDARELRRAADFMIESAFVQRMLDHLEPEDTIYDIGANIGLITLALAATEQGRSCRFHCFEPEPRNFAQLECNLARNGFQRRALPQRLALGDRDGVAKLFVRGTAGEGRHSIATDCGSSGSITVPMSTITRYAHLTRCPPDVLKIDVEGAEGHVLAGLHPLLRERPPREIFLEVHRKGLGDRMPDGSPLHEWLLGQGYTERWSRRRRSGRHCHYRRH